MTCDDTAIRTADLSLAQGDQRTFAASVVDKSGELEDISGASAIRFSIYTRQGGDVVLEKTLAATEIVISPNNYQFSWTITGPESAAISAGWYWYECYMVASGGEPSTIGAGYFKIQKTAEGSA
jgi:hypothetical protein